MKKIAYLASRVTLPDSLIRRTDAFEHDLMMDALRPAFAARGLKVDALSWDDAAVNWADYEAAIIGTTWDYWTGWTSFLPPWNGSRRRHGCSIRPRWYAGTSARPICAISKRKARG